MAYLGDSNVSVVIDGKKLVDQLRRLVEKNFKRAADHANRVVAARLLFDSKRYVPVLTGDLKDSGRVEEMPSGDEALRIVQIVYGSAEVVYAAIQHNHPTYNHPSLGFAGPTLYLQKPLVDNHQYYLTLWVTEFELFLKRAGR